MAQRCKSWLVSMSSDLTSATNKRQKGYAQRFPLEVTPNLGSTLCDALRYIPFAIMLFSGISTTFLRQRRLPRTRNERIQDPTDAFLPGIGFCLQYIQFVVLTGCLTLAYPGYFKPIVSQVGWSILMYATGPVTHGFKYPAVGDRIYQVNGTYGFEEMVQVIGAPTMQDLWINVILNLVIVICATAVLIHMFSLVSWKQSHSQNNLGLVKLKYIGWNIIRVVLDCFLLPIIAFSSYQINIWRLLPIYHTLSAAAFIAILGVLLFFVLRYLIVKDRSHNFFGDSGPSSNVVARVWLSQVIYCLPVVRGIAIGGLQRSGLVQIAILSACEVFCIFVIISGHHRSSVCSRNTCLVVARLLTVLLGSVFLPETNRSEVAKEWIGYVILLIHATVLLCRFLFYALIQLIISILMRGGMWHGSLKEPLVDRDSAPVCNLYQLSQRENRGHIFDSPSIRGNLEENLVDIQHGDSGRSARHGNHPILSPDEDVDQNARFYRAPRPRYKSISPSNQASRNISSSLPSCPSDSSDPEIASAFDLQTSIHVDYSVREADFYYRRPEIERQLTRPESGQKVGRMSVQHSLQQLWVRWTHSPPKEFSVSRPSYRSPN